MEERRKRGAPPDGVHIEIKTVDVNVSALAREAGLSEAVASGHELLAFSALLIDVVMAQAGATKTGEQWALREQPGHN